MNSVEKENPKERSLRASLVAFAYELGIAIVIPLAIFLFIGIFIDKKFDTKPFGIIVALILSLAATSISIAKKVKKFTIF